MAEQVVSGLTGSVAFTGCTPVINGRFGAWRARVSFEPLRATGFGATMVQRITGLGDCSGMAIGYQLSGDSAANPGLSSTTTPSTAVVTLQTDGTNSVITATCMISAIDLAANIEGTTASPLGITFLNAGAHISVNWGGSNIP